MAHFCLFLCSSYFCLSSLSKVKCLLLGLSQAGLMFWCFEPGNIFVAVLVVSGTSIFLISTEDHNPSFVLLLPGSKAIRIFLLGCTFPPHVFSLLLVSELHFCSEQWRKRGKTSRNYLCHLLIFKF